MARWMALVVSALWAGAGAAVVDADYSAARMPQYDSLNYETHAASPPAEDYHDRSPDVAAARDYNQYDQESNENKRHSRNHRDEDSYHMPVKSKVRKESATVILDDIDADYNFKSEEPNSINEYNKRLRYRNKIESNGPFSGRSKFGNNNLKNNQHVDDEDTDVPPEHFEDEKSLGTDRDKSKFVRRDISQQNRRKSRNQVSSEEHPDYDEESEVYQGNRALKVAGPMYSDPDLSQDHPIGRPSGYKTQGDDKDLLSPGQPGGHKAPMPKPRKKTNEYVDYNDMSRIEKIKSQTSRRTTARPGASRRWSFHDGFRRRYFNTAPPETEEHAEILTTTQTSYTQPTPVSTIAVSTNATPPWLITGVDEPIVPLSKAEIANITAFVNQSKQLSIAELSQLSILKKAQRKDSVKDEMLKGKPPVLLQVTERVQTVVMVEPPPSTQEPWLRARDIAEDSPDRIAKVKRFMRNKLVANARNISELMENWDDTVCDYVDISLLDESKAVWTHAQSHLSFVLSWVLAAQSTLFWCGP